MISNTTVAVAVDSQEARESLKNCFSTNTTSFSYLIHLLWKAEGRPEAAPAATFCQ
jgi:hypothetical protein